MSKIGSGWYKVKATSNSGIVKYAWIKVLNISDALTRPDITIETEGKAVNGWYGADQKELYIKVATNSPSAKEIHYTLTGAHIQDDTIGELKEEGNTKYILVPITETGITSITAWTEDGQGYSSEENGLEVKYDNIPPELGEIEKTGIEGTNSWYKSDIDLKINATDLNGKDASTIEEPKATLDGYIYTIQTETETTIIPETHIKNIDQIITTREINSGVDGIYKVKLQAIDQAGNKSAEKEELIKKDTKAPTVETPNITNITAKGFSLTVSAGDTTSGVAYYEYYLNGALAETKNEGVWAPNNLNTDTSYNIVVKVYDNAGWSQDSDSVPVTTINQVPTITAQYLSKTTNSITFNATGSDSSDDKLTYYLYVSTDGTNWGTAKATLSNQTPNTQVTLTANDLTEYTDYYWKVEVYDTKSATANTGRQGPVRTYCPGSRCKLWRS